MISDHYLRVKELFVEALEHSDDARADLLAQRCGDDESLRREVEQLLRLDADSSDSHNGDDTLFPSPLELPNRIANYEITGLLGAGGMGCVFRARQENPDRDVALKVLHPGLASKRMLQRFEHETQVLARMRHPAIAEIHEASTWEGRPFFVMELVDGLPLTHHADEHELDVPARIDLLTQVGEAVEHAHQRGVVHRDLKPGNVLVTPGGRVKILDFGVARTTDNVLATTARTRSGELIGTLPYMSPEQVSGDPSAVGSPSDVYSLGVLAFELLSGRLPYDLDHCSVPEAATVIRDSNPTPLGTWDRRLRGDLETVVAKALAKEPERRYASAADFVADLRRVRDEEPITARPPSALYRVRKFTRRNPTLVAALTVLFATLTGATLVATSLAVEARRQAGRADAEAAKVGAVNQLLVDMLGAADPNAGKVDAEEALDVRVVDVLDWAAENLIADYASEPEVEAALRSTIADTYLALGERDKVLAQLGQVRERWLRESGPHDLRTIRAAVGYAEKLTYPGAPQEACIEAEEILRPCLSQLEAQLGEDHPDTIGCLSALFSSLYYQRRLDEAEGLAREAVARAERALPIEHPVRLWALNNLAGSTEPEEMARILREVLAVRVASVGRDHPDTTFARGQLVGALRRLGLRDEAADLQAEVTASTARVYGEGHPKTLFNKNNLAVVLGEAGRHEEAIRTYEAVLAGYEALDRSTVGLALSARNSLVSLLVEREDAAAAEPLAREALDLWTQERPTRKGAAVARYHLGRVLQLQERHAEADPLLSRARQQAADDGHAQLETRAGRALARTWVALGEFEQAERLLLADYDARIAADPEHPPQVVVDQLVELYEAWGRPADAEAWRSRGELDGR